MKKVSFFFKDSKPTTKVAGLCFLVLLGFLFSTGIQLFFPAADYTTPSGVRWALIAQGIATFFIFGFPALAFAITFQRSCTQYLQLDFSIRKWTLSAIAMVTWVLLTPAIDWLSTWNSGWNFGSMESSLRRYADLANTTTEHLLSLATPADLLLQITIVALIPSICEELFFRGALQQSFQKCLGNRHIAVLITAIFFALAHGDLYGLMPRFIMGAVLGYLYIFGESIIINTLVHFFNNATVVSLYYCYHGGVIDFSPSTPLSADWITTICCTLAAIILFIVYFAKKPIKNEEKTAS